MSDRLPWPGRGRFRPAPPAERINRSIGTRLADVGRLATSAVTFGLAVALLIGLGMGLIRGDIILQPFHVPEALSKRGYTGEVLALRLADEVSSLYRKAYTTYRQPATVAADVAEPDFDIPGTHFSVRKVSNWLRYALRLPVKALEGEITYSSTGLLQMRLRISQGNSHTVRRLEARSDEPDELLRAAAEEIVAQGSPYLYASYLYEKGRHHEAIDLIKACLAEKPADAWFHNLYGFILNERECAADGASSGCKAAEAEYRAAIRSNPRFGLAWANLGAFLAKQGLPVPAEEKLRQAIALGAQPIGDVYDMLADVLAAQGRSKEALEAYQLGVEHDPANPRVYVNAGIARHKRKEYDAAIVYYQRAQRVDSEVPLLYLNWGNALVAKNALDEAIAKYRRQIAGDANEMGGHIGLAYCLYRKSDFAGAAAEYRQVLMLQPNDKAVLSTLQNVELKMRQESAKGIRLKVWRWP